MLSTRLVVRAFSSASPVATTATTPLPAAFVDSLKAFHAKEATTRASLVAVAKTHPQVTAEADLTDPAYYLATLSIKEKGLQDYSIHPNPVVRDFMTKISNESLDGAKKLEGLSEEEWAQVHAYDFACTILGQTLAHPKASDAEVSALEATWNRQHSEDIAIFNKALPVTAQKTLWDDLLYLKGTTEGRMPTTVTTSSLPLQMLIGFGVGTVGALLWLRWANQERHRIHHKANSWRLEGPGLKSI